MKKRVLAVICASIMLVILCACSEGANKTVNVELDFGDGLIVDGTVTLPEASNSGECFRQFCNDNDFVIEGVDDGYITKVGGWTNAGDYAWMFYINGELSDIGVKEYVPESDDTIKLAFVNWTEIDFEME